AKKAHIHDFISKLPKGYDTLVGNNGIRLSGGQRQRIAVARAILKDAPILVMDEATSALDSRNELMIQKSLQSVIRGKTALIIAHRLSTLRNMDKIIVIKNGKIIESGSHQQLLRQNGVYKRLWNLQSAGFRDKK
ncbi:MAG: ATP-binding cassette domain-containing protein, partial [Alphaproteobacteria bacterium]|nr:ATP-binding cassette domain-containing protein [Alphaproteobacteria bacterium]